MKRIKASTLIMIAGILLIAVAVLILVFSGSFADRYAKKARDTADRLTELMPEIYDTAPDDRINMTMPAVSIDGIDYVGIIEVSKYSCRLPIGEAWNRGGVKESPLKFTGSIYDGSLVIGGSDATGQLDFMTKISIGDTVTVTDMAGGRYSYTVTDIRRTADVSSDNLTSKDADLVIFARNTYSFDYTVVSCKFGY